MSSKYTFEDLSDTSDSEIKFKITSKNTQASWTGKFSMEVMTQGDDIFVMAPKVSYDRPLDTLPYHGKTLLAQRLCSNKIMPKLFDMMKAKVAESKGKDVETGVILSLNYIKDIVMVSSCMTPATVG